MKRTKILLSSVILCMIVLMSTLSSAVEISIDDKEVSPGEEFTLEIKLNEKIVLGNSHITYDSNLIEFKGTDQANLSSNEATAGEVAWMYTDMNENSEGVNSLIFKFKAKDDISKKQEVVFKLSDVQFVTANADNADNEITGDTEFKATINGKSSGLIIKIVIAIVILLLVFIIIKKIRIPKRSH